MFEINTNKGIIKKTPQGEFEYVLKDLNNGNEFPMAKEALDSYGMIEGDILEYVGRVEEGIYYLAISEISEKLILN